MRTEEVGWNIDQKEGVDQDEKMEAELGEEVDWEMDEKVGQEVWIGILMRRWGGSV